MGYTPAGRDAVLARWGEKYIIQLTTRQAYTSASTLDEVVLETAWRQAMEYVAQRKGAAYADTPLCRPVIECVPYCLYAPGAAPTAVADAYNTALDRLVQPAAGARVAQRQGFEGYSGAEFLAEVDTTRGSRSRRSWF